MTQREKDYRAWLKLPPPEDDSRPALFCDGAEYGRRDLAKLERLLRAGAELQVEKFGRVFLCVRGLRASGTTLAEALEQIK